MLNTFSSVTPFLKFDPKRVIIDNAVFKLHYRWTFLILIVATLLVTSRQYIGEHIKCINGSIDEKVLNTFCFFTTTFTLVRHLNNTAIDKGLIFQPGIGPYETQDEPIKRHAYYQWVPFVLFGQALCFYLPHFVWKRFEGQRIRALVFGLRMVGLSRYLKTESLKIGKLNIPSLQETELRIKDIRRSMIDRMRLNQSWGARLVFCELLNLFNLLVQIFYTNHFLGGHFFRLGINVMQERWDKEMDVLDIVFPKVTKCHFYKFGPSGGLQLHDTLCVMALNIINEKIFAILWFWYVFVFACTVLGLIWRILTLFLYKRPSFTKYVFYWAKPGNIDESELGKVIAKCNFSNWMFLYFLRINLSEFLFQKVIYHLASEFPDPTTQDNAINAQRARAHAANDGVPAGGAFGGVAVTATAPTASTSQQQQHAPPYATPTRAVDDVDMPLLPRTNIDQLG